MTDTIIGPNITIDGELSGEDPVVVEGTVKGKINTSATVEVAEQGVVEADVNTPDVAVSGQVTGNIVAGERVEIRTEGRMVGDIKAPRILIAEGASFKGHIDMDVE